MLCIIQQSIFDGKVIHYNLEKGVFCVMLSKYRRVFDRLLYVWCQVLDYLLVCDSSGLLEYIHAFDNINEEKSLVVVDSKKAVLIDNFWGD